MNKNQPFSNHVSALGVETITLTNREFKDVLGLQLPKTAKNYRAFGRTPKIAGASRAFWGFLLVTLARLNSENELLLFKKALEENYTLIWKAFAFYLSIVHSFSSFQSLAYGAMAFLVCISCNYQS